MKRNDCIRVGRARRAAIVGGALGLAVTTSFAQDEEEIAKSVTRQMWRDIKLGKLRIEGDHAAVEALVLRRNIPITYDYIAALMRAPNAFTEHLNEVKDWINEGEKNDEQFQQVILPLFTQPKSFNEVDLTSYEAIMKAPSPGLTRSTASHPYPSSSQVMRREASSTYV